MGVERKGKLEQTLKTFKIKAEVVRIEQAWSKIKAYLRKVKARTSEALFSAIGIALDTITCEDIEGWVKYCGYGLS